MLKLFFISNQYDLVPNINPVIVIMVLYFLSFLLCIYYKAYLNVEFSIKVYNIIIWQFKIIKPYSCRGWKYSIPGKGEECSLHYKLEVSIYV